MNFARDVGAVAGALDAVRAANDASDPTRWEDAHGALERNLAAAERSLERARGAAVEADPATRQRLADAERELVSHREAATRFVGPPRGWKPVAREAEILAVLGAPVQGPTRDGFARKEARLARELEQLTLADSRILRGRITKASAGDPIAEKLATFSPERRARIIELLDGARRREALRAARGPGKLPDPVRGDLEAATGRSLGHVRVHDDDEGHSTAAQHGARAVAIGSDIHMGHGELDATSPGGRALLAHEVAHVVQAEAQPGPPLPAAKRDAGSTDAAEVEADAFAERFVQHGAGATWRPTAAVGARTPMRTPAVAAAPRPAAPAPAAAVTYFAQHQAQFFDPIRARLAGLSLPPPHTRLVWAGASAALAAAFEPAMIATRGSGMDLALALPELVYPADPWQAIDLHRDAAAGLAAWSPVAGQALALAFESVLRTSLPRMGLRYVAFADDYDGHVTPDLLVASHPFDRVVARLICDPAIAHYVRSQAPRGRRPASVDTDAPTAFKNGLRLVGLNWLTGSMWNYVEVTSPPDATLEEVSATLFERGDGTNHTEYAYGLVAVGRYVRIPRRWARELPGVIDQDLHDEDDGKGELALADSDLADAEAGAEAGAARKPADPGALAKTFGQTRADLTLAADLLGAWGLADLLGPARRWVDKHAAKLAKAAPETLGTWGAIAQAQRGVLHDALSDLTDVTSVAANAHVQPGSDASPGQVSFFV